MINSRYQILSVLGEGGFGKTYLTEDTHMPSKRRCVVKALKAISNNPQISQLVTERFQREAAILEELGEQHPQVPKLYAYFSENDQFYLVQELIMGRTLTDLLLKGGVFGEHRVREILLSLLGVLEFIHSKGIIHRDIKPDNIIIRDRDSQPVLIDFGAVRETLGTIVNTQGETTRSIVIGTPGFMPSEQAAGRPLFSSDLYSLGLTMIYLLTGKNPQELPSDPYNGSIEWQRFAPNVSPNLAMVLNKVIQPNPRDRYLNSKQMREALTANPDINQSVPPTVIDPFVPPTSSPVNNIPAPLWVGGGGTFNTSVPVPQEISGWNWGAFLLGPLWSINNNVWIGLLTFIPWVGFVMAIILGTKGNSWAWRSREWKNIDTFKANQRAWAKAGVITYGAIAALFILAVILIPDEEVTKNQNETTNQTEQTTTPVPSPSSPPPSVSPTPVTTPTVTTKTVSLDNFKTYQYKNNLFAVDVPESWEFQDTSQGKITNVIWTDPTGNAFIHVNINPDRGNNADITNDQMSSQLASFIKRVFGDLNEFSMEKSVIQRDNSIRITWSYADETNGRVILVGNSFIGQDDSKTGIFTIVVPNDQFNSLQKSLNQIINSFKGQ